MTYYVLEPLATPSEQLVVEGAKFVLIHGDHRIDFGTTGNSVTATFSAFKLAAWLSAVFQKYKVPAEAMTVPDEEEAVRQFTRHPQTTIFLGCKTPMYGYPKTHGRVILQYLSRMRDIGIGMDGDKLIITEGFHSKPRLELRGPVSSFDQPIVRKVDLD